MKKQKNDKKNTDTEIKINGIFVQASFLRVYNSAVKSAEYSPSDKDAVIAFEKMLKLGEIKHHSDIGINKDIPSFIKVKKT